MRFLLFTVYLTLQFDFSATGLHLREPLASTSVKRIDVPRPIYFAITDSTGADASNRVDVFLQQPTLNSLSQKRAASGSRPMNQCYTPWDIYSHSQCLREICPQCVRITCNRAFRRYPATSFWYLRCLPDELCVDGVKGIERLPQAYCVSMENFVKIAQDQLGQTDGSQAAFAFPQDTKQAVEAILTGPDSNTSIFAANLGIEAQRIEELKGVRAWQVMENGTQSCQNCASASIPMVPPETQRISVKVAMQAASTKGLLFLAGIST